MSLRRLSLIAGLILLGATVYRVGSSSAADEWLPISPEELKMTSVPEGSRSAGGLSLPAGGPRRWIID